MPLTDIEDPRQAEAARRIPGYGLPFAYSGQGPFGMHNTQLGNMLGRFLSFGTAGPASGAAAPLGFGGVINRSALRRVNQEQQPPAVQPQNAAAASAEQPAFGRNVFDSPEWNQMAGIPSGDALRALSLARGDMSQAQSIANPRAQNVLNYWRAHPGFNSRQFADPAQSRAYWDALQQFQTLRRPDQ